jgi:hypothetical protein
MADAGGRGWRGGGEEEARRRQGGMEVVGGIKKRSRLAVDEMQV